MTQPDPYIILSAFAFDETGECALHEAVRSAGQFPNSELHIIHVTPDLGEAQSDTPSSLRAQVDQAPALLEERVQQACAGLSLRVYAHIRRGDAASAILHTAAEIGADLLVIGSHRRHGVAKLVLGSVAERILHEAHCPVLLALPKTWQRAVEIEAACPDCVRARSGGDAAAVCERHARARMRPHTYSPSDRRPTPISWT